METNDPVMILYLNQIYPMIIHIKSRVCDTKGIEFEDRIDDYDLELRLIIKILSVAHPSNTDKVAEEGPTRLIELLLSITCWTIISKRK